MEVFWYEKTLHFDEKVLRLLSKVHYIYNEFFIKKKTVPNCNNWLLM